MSDTAPSTLEHCDVGGRERSRLLGMAVLAFAAAGVFDQLVAGVFVPLTQAFEWLARSHGGLCVHLTRDPLQSIAGIVPVPSGSASTTAGDPVGEDGNRAYATRIAVFSVAAAAVATGLISLGGTLLG